MTRAGEGMENMKSHRYFACGLLSLALAMSWSNPVAAKEGRVLIDGSSTVAPVTMAAAEMFRSVDRDIQVTVGISGTGGGFKKFLDQDPKLRTDINDASRSIKPSEIKKAKSLGIEFIEFPIAIDGIAVVINPANDFCDSLTVEELKKIWMPGSTINNWNQIRSDFPDMPLKLYGPGPDSGTFDYFTEAIVGESKASRSDYTASESDNQLVHGVAGDRGALGYFGFSYYEANKRRLKIIGIDPGTGNPVVPSLEVIGGGTYKPLSRPLFMYVNKASWENKPEVRKFVTFILDNARKIVEHPRVNYVALPDQLYDIARQRLEEGVTGTVFGEEGSHTSKSLVALFKP